MAFACECSLQDCAYFRPGAKAGQCLCQHTDKHHHPKNPCPLYRKDWNRKDSAADELKARLLRRR